VLLLGANRIALAIAELLQNGGERVTMIDANPEVSEAARQAGFDVVCANGIEEPTLARVGAETRAVCAGLTANETINLLFARKIREQFRGPAVGVALEAGGGLTVEAVHDEGAQVLFGAPCGLRRWLYLASNGALSIETWVFHGGASAGDSTAAIAAITSGAILPLVVARKRQVAMFDDGVRLSEGDRVVVAVANDEVAAAHARLQAAGYGPAAPHEALLPSTPPRIEPSAPPSSADGA
jgi:hypothetical protein